MKAIAIAAAIASTINNLILALVSVSSSTDIDESCLAAEVVGCEAKVTFVALGSGTGVGADVGAFVASEGSWTCLFTCESLTSGAGSDTRRRGALGSRFSSPSLDNLLGVLLSLISVIVRN